MLSHTSNRTTPEVETALDFYFSAVSREACRGGMSLSVDVFPHSLGVHTHRNEVSLITKIESLGFEVEYTPTGIWISWEGASQEDPKKSPKGKKVKT